MGYFGKATTSKEKTEEETAKERLELVLTDLGMDKRIDTTYNENDYMDAKIDSQEGMIVLEDDIVSVDGWKFEIDRSVPKIGKSLGKEELNTSIKVTANSQVSKDYTKSTITIEILYEGEIETITINGEELEVPQKQEDGKYVLTTEVVDNGNYEIMVNAKEGGFNRKKVKVSEIIKNMYIYNKEDMEKFRDIVNGAGRTFKGNTIYVMDEIYLEGSNSNPWIPIKNFEGTFEGNNHTINGVYIDSSENMIGLFKQNKGIIQNIIISKDSFIKGNSYVGGIVGLNYGTIEHVINNGKIDATESPTGGIAGRTDGKISKTANLGNVAGNRHTGGISGQIYGSGTIEECVNSGTITMKTGAIMGGIVARAYGGNIQNCYNTGILIGTGDTYGGIIGYTGDASDNTISLKNCYNIGKLQTGTHLQGGIVGNNEKLKMQATNNYWLDTCGASVGSGRPSGNTNAVSKTEAQMKALAATLGDSYTNDIQNEDGSWKYNNGYPILKWQLEN